WQRQAFPHAVPWALPSGLAIRLAPPPYLLAMKLEAFASRGRGDLYASRDFEDVIRLLDGREELAGELVSGDGEVRSFVMARLAGLREHPDFDSAAEGALGGGPETLGRFEQVLRPRIDAVAGA